STDGGTSREQNDSDNVRYFINIGRKDGFDWMDIKDLLRDLLNLGKDDIFHVDSKDSFSFFNTAAQHQELVLSAFENFKLEGRHVNVEISKEGGGRRDHNRRGKSEGFGRKEG